MRHSARKLGVLFFAAMSVYAVPTALADATASSDSSGNTAQRSDKGTSGAAKPTVPAGAGYVTKAKPVSTSTTSAGSSTPMGQSGEDFVKQLQDQEAANRAKINEAGAVLGIPPVTPASSQTKPGDPFTSSSTVVTPGADGNSVTTDDVNVDNDSGAVEIHVNDANLVEVLRMLSLQSQKNIIASKEVKGSVTANLYGVTVREALDAILKSNGYTYKEDGNFIYVYTADEVKAMEQANRVRRTEVIRLHYVTAGSASIMLKPVLSESGELAFSEPAEVGIGSGGSTGGNGLADQDILVITDFDDRIDEVKRVIKEIDRRPQQILIEATILRATLKENNAMGIDFQVLGGVDFGTLSGAGGNFASASTNAFVNTSGAAAITDKGYTAAGTGFTSGVPNGGLQVGIAKNNIAIFLKALESVTDTSVIANPKILSLNKQKGEVFIGNDIGYRTTVTNENNTTSEQVEFLQTGTHLVFRPFIGEDGYIRMEIKPEDSSGSLQDGLPFKFTTEVSTNILVRDGHTVVIGGLFRENSNTQRGQVPGLGNVPIVGMLFKNQVDDTTREEIIVLLTPHIVKDDAAYSQMSEEELARIEELRVGVRRGMMPWGRERLAESAYDAAVQEMAKPNPDTGAALWNLNCATNLNPKFSEAIELKEQINGKRVSSVDNSLTRSFVRKAILQDLDRTKAATTPTASAVMSTSPESAGDRLPNVPIPFLLNDPMMASIVLGGFRFNPGTVGTVVNPSFEDAAAANSPRYNAALSLQNTLRSQFQLYQVQHNDALPPGMNGHAGLTDGATAWNELLIETDATGAAGTNFGPYVTALPKNPLNSFTGVWVGTTDGDAATPSAFIVNKTNGKLWLTAANGLTRLDNEAPPKPNNAKWVSVPIEGN